MKKSFSTTHRPIRKSHLSQECKIQDTQINECDTVVHRFHVKDHTYFNRCNGKFNKILFLFMRETLSKTEIVKSLFRLLRNVYKNVSHDNK